MIEVKKITPTIGAMIEGVNFSEPIKENVFDQIYEILIENLVIFFRNTSISPMAHLEFSENFGELDDPHPVYPSVEGFENDKKYVKLEKLVAVLYQK